MKKPLFIIFNDVHIKQGREDDILRAIKHMLKYAKNNSISTFVMAGDMFDSRSFQRQSELNTFQKILEMIYNNGCKVYLVPGNHDKTEYSIETSFLDNYKYHPGVTLAKEKTEVNIDGVSITLIPFFSEDVLVPILKNSDGGDILISHFEMNGSTHLGKTVEKSRVNKILLKKWKKVYLGHFHNLQEITIDIVHLPSLMQNDFGEDANKGFSVIYDDLSYEVIRGVFKEFTKVCVNIDTIQKKDLKELVETHKNSDGIVRFEFTGEESKLKAIDKTFYQKFGIDVKLKYEKVFDAKTTKPPAIIKKYRKEDVVKKFEEFCKEKGFNYDDGIVYLNNFLKNKE